MRSLQISLGRPESGQLRFGSKLCPSSNCLGLAASSCVSVFFVVFVWIYQRVEAFPLVHLFGALRPPPTSSWSLVLARRYFAMARVLRKQKETPFFAFSGCVVLPLC